MQLLSDRTGWVLADHRLKWTNDAGTTWRDITPTDLPSSDARWSAGEVAYFLDASTGWLLATRPHDIETPSDLIVWRTRDGGATWQKTRLDGPEVGSNSAPPYFEATALQFADARAGWFALVYASGMHGGTEYFSTRDGGASWSGLPGLQGYNGSSGPVHFANGSDGWAVWDEGVRDVAVTHDGGRSWDYVAFQAPAGSGHASPWMGGFAYGDVGPDAGMIPVDFGYGAGGTGIYATHDAGRSWVLASRAQDSCGPLAFVSLDVWVQATDRNVYATEDGGANWRAIDAQWPAAVAGSKVAPLAIAFADADHGWAVIGIPRNAGATLVATADGGHTWRVVRP